MEIEDKKLKQKQYLLKFWDNNSHLKSKVFICEDCGGEYKYFNKSKHCKTKYHTLVLKKLNLI